MSRLLFVGTILVVTILATQAGTAVASDGQVAAEIAYALKNAPGGAQTARNQITWPDGAVFTAEPTSAAARVAAASCSSGKFCVYSGLNASGSHLDFSTCPSTNGVAALPQVRSISNARNAATVTGRKGSIVIVSVSDGATKNVTKTIDKVVCA